MFSRQTTIFLLNFLVYKATQTMVIFLCNLRSNSPYHKLSLLDKHLFQSAEILMHLLHEQLYEAASCEKLVSVIVMLGLCVFN